MNALDLPPFALIDGQLWRSLPDGASVSHGARMH